MSELTTINIANLFRIQDIRCELQTLRRRVKGQQTRHLLSEDGDSAALKLFTHTHDRNTCPTCQRNAGRVTGIEEAIALFGGRRSPAKGKFNAEDE